MIKLVCLIAGGAIGTVLRYGILMLTRDLSTSHNFPFGVMTVNVVGSLLIGFCWACANFWHLSDNMRLFLFMGLFGGFTTYSTYALDTFSLLKAGDYKFAFINILASNVLAIVAVFIGYIIGKQIIKA